jgi:hypothetical protein
MKICGGGSIELERIHLYTDDNYWWESHLSDLWVIIAVVLDILTKRSISYLLGDDKQ